MSADKYLKMIQQEIHSVVFATTDQNHLPFTCVIDIMLADENGLYFPTAKGKAFYERLKIHPFISLTGLKGTESMSSQSVTLRGKVREIGQERLKEIFEQNPYMNLIYPHEESRTVLTVFQIYQGSGEFFDLSQKPVFRELFSFGSTELRNSIYFVNENCNGCNRCLNVCPQSCNDISAYPVKIQQEHCLHCGKCKEVCPLQAIERREA